MPTYDPERYQRNREAQLAASKRYYQRNREALRAKQKEYDDAHRDEIAKRHREKQYHAGKLKVELS